MEWSGDDDVELLEAAGMIGSSYSAEAVALRMAMSYVHDRVVKEARGFPAVAFCTDSLSVLQRLQGFPGREDSAVIDEIRVLARRLGCVASIHMVWVPGHAGVPGNEAVDSLAKEAATLPQDDSPIPLSCAKAKLKALTTKTWRDGLRRDWHYHATFGHPPKVLDDLSRLEARTLAQLRTGHCHFLQAYKSKIGLSDDPTCPHCGDGPEDANHLLATCANWTAPRRDCFGLDDLIDPKRVLRFLRKIGYL